MVPYALPPAGRIDPGQAAAAVIRKYCGWHVAPSVTETITLTPPHETGRRLLLPTGHITRLNAVVTRTRRGTWEDHTDNWDWAQTGILERTCGPIPPTLDAIRVNLTHGWDWEDVPDLRAVFDAVKERAARVATPYRSQTAGPYRAEYALIDGVPVSGAALLSTERATLAPYRLQWGP